MRRPIELGYDTAVAEHSGRVTDLLDLAQLMGDVEHRNAAPRQPSYRLVQQLDLAR